MKFLSPVDRDSTAREVAVNSRLWILAAMSCLGLAGGDTPARAVLQAESMSEIRDVDMQLPSGRRQPSVQGRFVVLAVLQQEALVVARRGDSMASQPASVVVPAGTELVIPSISGWDLAFGAPETDLRPAVQEDRHFGLGHVDVEVQSYSNVHPNGTRNARLRVHARLGDVDGDDRWWATVRYQLIALGR